MPIVCLGLNHRTAPVTVREQFALAEGKVPGLLGGLREAAGAEEAVVLSTCNRVELYAAGSSDAAAMLGGMRDFLLDGRDAVGEDVFYELTEPESVEHLFQVASGLDSMVLQNR